MAKITAAEVNNLRKTTGAGMMDCKKALVEADGNSEKAIEILRKKGQKVAAKRADRESSEGAAITKTNDDNTTGVAIVLGCETDFVGKNEDFVDLANKIAEIALNCNSKEELNKEGTVPWGSIPKRLEHQGGDLYGVIEKLEYLKDLGVNILYLNPIFLYFFIGKCYIASALGVLFRYRTQGFPLFFIAFLE